MTKRYPTKAPYQKTSDKKPFKNIAKIFSSRETASRMEHKNTGGKKGR
jgi:hypothetical protein